MTTVEAPPRWTVKRTDTNVIALSMKHDSAVGWEQWFLLRSDTHHDNPHCRRDLEKRHLEEAAERGAGVIDCGDLFDAMQGREDRRASKSELKDEYKRGDYLDALVKEAADFYEPFAHQFVLIGRGNHETSVRTRHETDLTERLVATLNDRSGAHIVAGGYTGWIVFFFRFGNECTRRVLWYTHGYGGGGPVTQDVIQAQRQTSYLEGVDYTVSGHTHDAWHLRRERLKLNHAGHLERRTLHQLKLGCYKDDYADGHLGWHVETGKPPKPVGAWWLKFTYKNKKLREQFIFAD
jgi:hypothetical protein